MREQDITRISNRIAADIVSDIIRNIPVNQVVKIADKLMSPYLVRGNINGWDIEIKITGDHNYGSRYPSLYVEDYKVHKDDLTPIPFSRVISVLGEFDKRVEELSDKDKKTLVNKFFQKNKIDLFKDCYIYTDYIGISKNGPNFERWLYVTKVDGGGNYVVKVADEDGNSANFDKDLDKFINQVSENV